MVRIQVERGRRAGKAKQPLSVVDRHAVVDQPGCVRVMEAKTLGSVPSYLVYRLWLCPEHGGAIGTSLVGPGRPVGLRPLLDHLAQQVSANESRTPHTTPPCAPPQRPTGLVGEYFASVSGGIPAQMVSDEFGREGWQRYCSQTEPAMVATYAWDRLLIDPLPGPRSPEDFDNLSLVGAHNFEVLAETTPRPPAGSTLPRLARVLQARLLLLDPYGGATGMAEQLAELVKLSGAERIGVVDVGGDVLGQPDDRGLRSPLADALALAAVASVGVPADLYVAGLGLDGEVPEEVVRSRLVELGARCEFSLGSDVLSDEWLDLLTWHPSEATALWVAAGLGLRGIVEIRDAGTPVTLTDDARDVWMVNVSEAIEANPIARDILDAETASLTEVESVVVRSTGRSELEYEREKAARPARNADIALTDLEPAVAALQDAARSRSASYVTFRRLAEGLGYPSRLDAIRAWLIQTHAERYNPHYGRSRHELGADRGMSVRYGGRLCQPLKARSTAAAA